MHKLFDPSHSFKHKQASTAYNTCIKPDPKAHTTRSENFSRLDNVLPETFEHNHRGRIKISELIGSYIAILELPVRSAS